MTDKEFKKLVAEAEKQVDKRLAMGIRSFHLPRNPKHYAELCHFIKHTYGVTQPEKLTRDILEIEVNAAPSVFFYPSIELVRKVHLYKLKPGQSAAIMYTVNNTAKFLEWYKRKLPE